MMNLEAAENVVSFDPLALERCFLTAHVLHASYGERVVEYGLLGVSCESNPFHVVRTSLLPGQRVTAASVYQSGHDVLRFRAELSEMSRHLGEAVVPILWCHRHSGSVRPSAIDEEFATQSFINHVAAVFSLRGARQIVHGLMPPACTGGWQSDCCAGHRGSESTMDEVEFTLGFTMIVNGRREYSIEAVRKEWCLSCGSSRTRCEPASLRVVPERAPTAGEIACLWDALESEIEVKMVLGNGVFPARGLGG